MADPLSFSEVLKEIAGLRLAESGVPEPGGAAEAGGAKPSVDREITAAVLEFVAMHVPVDSDSGEPVDPGGHDSVWLGNVTGLAMSEKFRDSGLNLPGFFQIYTRVKADFVDQLCRTIRKPAQLRPGLIILDRFFTGISAGFAQGWVRSIKANSRRRQQEAKRHILQEQKRYATVFKRMSEPAFVVDHALRVIDVNPAFENFFGISRVELNGSTCCDLIGHNFCDICPLEEIIGKGGSFSNVEVLVPVPARKGADPAHDKTILLAGAALGNLGDGNKGGIVIFQDITEQKRAAEELDEYRNWLEDLVDERTEELLVVNKTLQREIAERRYVEKELIQVTASLKQSNAELEQFAHVASHDLQEPLMLVASFAERLMARYGSSFDERGRDYLARITKGTKKLQNLVDALLQLSKISTCAAKFEPLDMNELVREVIADLEEIINRSGARVDIDPLHPLNGDAIQIRQLFQNLLSNALKYHRENEVPWVSISSKIVNDICEISVEDNGVGLEEGDLEKIFEPFVRLHGRERYEGTGMGLTTCKKIVARHGGEIVARGKPESGAVFIIRIPLHHHSSEKA